MIAEKIKQDIDNEFAQLNEALRQTHLKDDFDPSKLKADLREHVPKQIKYKSGMLLDTLLNYLMADAQKRIKSADLRLQNAFFDADFRKRVREWLERQENDLAWKPDSVPYGFDPRIKDGMIAAGITFVAGTGITLTLVPSVVGAIVAGIVTILLSALAFKRFHDRAAPKARELVVADIDKYLEATREQVTEWLGKVGAAFEDDFQAFCKNNGFALAGRPNE